MLLTITVYNYMYVVGFTEHAGVANAGCTCHAIRMKLALDYLLSVNQVH